jgi:ribosomal protein L11 methyltransferase
MRRGGTVQLSPRVVLHPHGAPPPLLPAGWIALAALPSAAFGDGSHVTTRLCAEAVDLWCRRRPGPRALLDVGTGTGILARIARARGVPEVVGTDLDPRALEAARANSALDAHPTEITLCDAPPEHWGPRFDLVVANLLEELLLALATPLTAALAPGATLLVSGFTPRQAPAVRLAFTDRGLTRAEQTAREGWALLALRRAF